MLPVSSYSTTDHIDYLLLTFGLALSGRWIHLVVLLAVAGEAAIHVNAQLITHITLQTHVDL